MATHLADIESILDTLDAAMVSNNFSSLPNKNKVGGDKWSYISDIEIYEIKMILKRITYLYSIELRAASEANIETLLETLITNIQKIMTYQTITDYTRPTSMCSIKPYNVGNITKNPKTGTWNCECKILVEWE